MVKFDLFDVLNTAFWLKLSIKKASFGGLLINTNNR